MNATTYIIENWKNTVRERKEDGNQKMGLPYPYTVPCIKEQFDDMYYWDTYFTNKGLICSENVTLAKNNVDNIAHLINRWGYMPNGSHFDFLGRSQPPFFGAMVKDVYDKIKDKNWLKNVYSAIEKEYKFWTEKRSTPSGLNRYYGDYTEKECANFYIGVKNRIKTEERDPSLAGLDYFAEAESGWDFTARFNGRCTDFNPVDLNCILYMTENSAAFICLELGLSSAKIWQDRAEKRKKLVNSLCFNKEKGVYLDYNYKTKTHSEIISCASFFPYFCGVAEKENIGGLKKTLSALEMQYALTAAEKTQNNYQWGYPNAWAPLHYVCVYALDKYGLKEDAERIAKKYVSLVDKNYEKTGGLWEKYNAETGGIDAVSEYGTPQMMGWTAGTYLSLKDYIETK